MDMKLLLEMKIFAQHMMPQYDNSSLINTWTATFRKKRNDSIT